MNIKNIPIHPLTLAFPKKIEAEFLRFYYSQYLPHMRISIILGMIIWGAFGIVDWWIAPREMMSQLVFVRYGIVWPVMIGSYFCCLARRPDKIVGLGIIIGILAPAFAIIAKMVMTPIEMASFWNAGLICIFIYGYMVMRARFVWASLTGVIILIAYQIAAIGIKDMPYGILVNNAFVLSMGNILGMYVCYTMESYVRRDFLSTKRIEEAAKRTLVANEQLHEEINVRVTAEQELQKHQDQLEQLVSARTKELDDTQHEIVYMLGAAAEYRDNETGEHIRRMSRSCVLLANELKVDEETAELLLFASQMHDIGKIGISDSILLKPGKLNSQEWACMQSHTTIGAKILSGNNSKLLKMAQVIAMSHHERWDGTGYPNGLSKNDIPLLGRIVSICDVFDALLSNRPYKKAWPVDEAIAEIDLMNEVFFDPAIHLAFKKILPQVLTLR